MSLLPEEIIAEVLKITNGKFDIDIIDQVLMENYSSDKRGLILEEIKTLTDAILNDLDEAFPVLDPVTGKKRNFFNPELYKLALAGRHPKYPGVHFKKFEGDPNAEKNLEIKKKKLSREQIKEYKKTRIIDFLKFLKRYLKMTGDKRKKIIQYYIKQFKVSKNLGDTNLFVENSYTNFKKHLGVTGAELIDIFEHDGAIIPIRKFEKELDRKLITKGEKEMEIDKLHKKLAAGND